ncbi:MAG: hypothetical protein GWN58_31810 [Anaerolineae bacterium]|nr:hypothetical protein [Anaerolineae bacterium]
MREAILLSIMQADVIACEADLTIKRITSPLEFTLEQLMKARAYTPAYINGTKLNMYLAKHYAERVPTLVADLKVANEACNVPPFFFRHTEAYGCILGIVGAEVEHHGKVVMPATKKVIVPKGDDKVTVKTKAPVERFVHQLV